jgi:hypothetical protein
MEWTWKTHLPFDTKDGQWLKNLAWHRQKKDDKGFLFVDGYDPDNIIDLGQKIMDENASAVYQVVKVVERKDHPGKPAGNNAYFMVKCERIQS